MDYRETELMECLELLRKLSNAFGPPGNENEVRSILREDLESYADEVKTDILGNVLFYHRGKSKYPKIMLAAHMDEVAFMIMFIEEKGFLRFHPLGSVANHILPGQRILLKGSTKMIRGTVGVKPPHLMGEEEQKKVVPIKDLFMDIGADNLKAVRKKGVEIGTLGVFNETFAELGEGYISGKAFDDRVGCTVLAQVFKAISDSPFNVVAVGTAQEEVGLRGARTATWQIEPEIGLALEGTFASDVPNSRPDRVSAILKRGPVITLFDRTSITNPIILQTLIKAGKDKKIPFQFKNVPSGGTDAGAIHLNKSGVPTGTVAVPCRYIHGPTSIAHITDLKNTIALITEFIKQISKSLG